MSVAKPDTTLSDMHYVYVTKPFPHPQPKPQSVKVQEDLPPMDNMPINSDENEWQQAPDGALPDSPSRMILRAIPYPAPKRTNRR